jgi:hypothetical protein
VGLCLQAKKNARKELFKQEMPQELQNNSSKGEALDSAESGNGAATMLLKAFHKQQAVNQRGGSTVANGVSAGNGCSPMVQIPAVGARLLPSFLPAMQRSASVPVM